MATVIKMPLYLEKQRAVLIAGTPSSNEEFVFTVNNNILPAAIHLSGHIADTYVLQSLVTDVDNTNLGSSGTWVTVVCDATNFNFDLNTTIRTINAPGVYKIVAPASVNGACNALICW